MLAVEPETLPSERLAWLWRAAAAMGALALALALWRVAVDVAPLATRAESRLDELRQVTADDLLSGTEGVGELRGRIGSLGEEVEPAQRTMKWVGAFSPALSWLPGAGQEIRAWASLTQRVHRDVRATTGLLDASYQLLGVYDHARSTFATPASNPSPATLRARVQGLIPSLRSAASDLRRASRLAGTYGLALQLPSVRSSMGPLGAAEERVMAGAVAGERVAGLLMELLDIAEDTQPLLSQFTQEGYKGDAWTIETLRERLADIGTHTDAAIKRLDELAGGLGEQGMGQRILTHLGSVRQLLEAVALMDRASARGLLAFDAAFQGEGVAGESPFGRGGLLRSIFELAETRGQDIDQAISELEDARKLLDRLAVAQDTGGLGPSVSILGGYASDLGAGLRLIRALAPVGRDLLVEGTTRQLLVLGQSADELRATGGFVSSVWLVTLANGEIESVDYRDSIRVDDWERLMLYPKAPPQLEEHMNAWVWLLRDVSWDPDFPTTARTAADMYKLGQRRDVDGVVAINQWTLLRLVEALGSIPSPVDGEPITPRNVLSVLERETDRHGRAYMDVAVQAVLDALSRPMPLPRLVALASKAYESLQERNALLFLSDPGLQATLHRYGWDGGVWDGASDYLYVVDSNVGWSKSDRNVERQVFYDADLARESGPRVRLTLRYNNHSGPGSPPCEPQWRHRGTDYSQLKNACYWNFLRVYIPQEARILSASSLPLPTESVSVEIGRGVPAQDTAQTTSSHNKTVFSGLSIVGAGETREINLVYDLPTSVVSRKSGLLSYELSIQKQPGIIKRDVAVRLHVPAGYRLASSSVPPTHLGDRAADFDITLTRDIVLKVEFTTDAKTDG